MTTIYVCKDNDVVIFATINQDECDSRLYFLVKAKAENNLLANYGVTEALLGTGLNNILLSQLGISEGQVHAEMENVKDYTTSALVIEFK
jgi:hypothetical protein